MSNDTEQKLRRGTLEYAQYSQFRSRERQKVKADLGTDDATEVKRELWKRWLAFNASTDTNRTLLQSGSDTYANFVARYKQYRQYNRDLLDAKFRTFMQSNYGEVTCDDLTQMIYESLKESQEQADLVEFRRCLYYSTVYYDIDD
jgi:hypothetical protein